MIEKIYWYIYDFNFFSDQDLEEQVREREHELREAEREHDRELRDKDKTIKDMENDMKKLLKQMDKLRKKIKELGMKCYVLWQYKKNSSIIMRIHQLTFPCYSPKFTRYL